MYSITRDYHFSAAHTIPGHPKCSRLHGHNYKVEVTLSSKVLDRNGMIMDFGEMDKIVDPIIEKFDHRYLLGTNEESIVDRPTSWCPGLFSDDWVHHLATPTSTVEDLAGWFFDLLEMRSWPTGVSVAEITVWENHKSRSTYRAG